MNMGLVQSFWAQNSLGIAFMWKQVGLISYENTTTSGSNVLFAWTKRLEFWCENELGARLLVPKTPRDSFCAKTIRAYLARKYYTFGIAFMSSFLYKIRCQSFGAKRAWCNFGPNTLFRAKTSQAYFKWKYYTFVSSFCTR